MIMRHLLYFIFVPFLVVRGQEPCAGLNLDGWVNNQVVVELHRNGESHACGSVTLTAQDFGLGQNKCTTDLSKYDVESFLTYLLVQKLDKSSCVNEDDPEPSPGFQGYCDRGETYTPILTDHEKLVRLPGGALPCRFFTREGVRISSVEQFSDLAMEKDQVCENGQTDCGKLSHIHIYAVSAGRVFMFAPSHVGETFDLKHVSVDSGLPVSLEVLNTNPRVFEIYNFFSKEESDELVAKALAETSETHRIKRSTTGTGENTVFNKRTSESGFDTHGKTAQKVKRRCMKVLGFDEYIEGHTDGLQILRYNATKAYTPHMDYMKDRTGRNSHDYESEFRGGNRFATILLYMSDPSGGETVFSEVWDPSLPESERKPLPRALDEVRASSESVLLEKGSWEEEMVATCRSRFSVQPRHARAVLFYSQLPSGKEDLMSKHGGCPVLSEEKPKWAANLWAWNTPREGFEGSPVKEGVEKKEKLPKQLKATFINTQTDPTFQEAELYYDESGYWGKIGFDDQPLVAYTYTGHKWNIRVNGEFVKQFIVGEEDIQEFKI